MEKIGSISILSIRFYSELHYNQPCQVCTLLASTLAVTCLLENCTLYKQLLLHPRTMTYSWPPRETSR